MSLKSAMILGKGLIRATLSIEKCKVSHKESHRRFLVEANKNMFSIFFALLHYSTQSSGTRLSPLLPASSAGQISLRKVQAPG